MRGATFWRSISLCSKEKFQSTLPMRGATTADTQLSCPAGYFNPHSPCGERLFHQCSRRPASRFQSTLPMRGATALCNWVRDFKDFNPHSPCGERPSRGKAKFKILLFQSTLPMRGATVVYVFARIHHAFQSTLPMRGATSYTRGEYYGYQNFNPHSPCGERL